MNNDDMWGAVRALGGYLPGVTPVAAGVARNTVQRLLGFWMLWHLYGGQDACIAKGVMSQTGSYRQRSEFHRVFGVDVQDWCPDMAAQVAKAGQARQEESNG